MGHKPQQKALAYGQRFEPGLHPARVTIQAAALPKGALVEIDVIAVAR